MSNGAGALLGALVLLVAAGVATWVWLDNQPKYPIRSHHEPIEVCEQYVKHYDPGAGVGAFRDSVVSELDESAQYQVVGSMNAAHGTGPVRRIDYVCELSHDGESGR